MKTKAKIITISSIVLVLALAAFIFFKFCFVFGEGVKAGQLNQLMYKGYVFKTFEGRLIQSGFKGQKGTNSIQSNEFNFSVVDKAVADSLMRCSGKTVELHDRTDPKMLGCFKLEFDNKMYDARIRTKIRRMRIEFAKNEYESKL